MDQESPKTAANDSTPMRHQNPAIILYPPIGRFSFGEKRRIARMIDGANWPGHNNLKTTANRRKPA